MKWTRLGQWLRVQPDNVIERRDPVVLEPLDSIESFPVPGESSPALGDAQETSAASATPSTRSQRIRSWRRRALLRKGVHLYSRMKGGTEVSSLAMLDESGIILSWYELGPARQPNGTGLVDRHISQFYLPADCAMGQPIRDLCNATIHGRMTQVGWRRYPKGRMFWATTVIEPIMLRDGRLQGYSYLTRWTNGPQRVVDTKHSDSLQWLSMFGSRTRANVSYAARPSMAVGA